MNREQKLAILLAEALCFFTRTPIRPFSEFIEDVRDAGVTIPDKLDIQKWRNSNQSVGR